MFFFLQVLSLAVIFSFVFLASKITGKYKNYFFITLIIGVVALFLLASNGHFDLYLGLGLLACATVIVKILKQKKSTVD